MEPKKKPPTQGVGVEGFVAFESKPEPVAPDWNMWARLAQHPPFEMFLRERHPAQLPLLEQSDGVARYLQEIQGKREFELLHSDYCKWHAEKGYWPNETPMGEVKNA